MALEGLIDKLIEKLTFYGDTFIAQLLTKIIVSFIILLIGFILGRIVEKVLYRFLHELELNKLFKKIKIRVLTDKILSGFAEYLVYFIFIILALNGVGITTTIMNIILIVVAALLLISIVLAIKNFIPNFISGILIYKDSLLKIGDKVKLDQLEGRVVSTNFIETQIKTKKGEIIHVPNSSITKKKIFIKKS